MKQHITEKQFNALSTTKQEALKQWTLDKGYAEDATEIGYGYRFEPLDEGKIWHAYPYLSVGQLIEFLAEKKKDIHIERFDGGKRNSSWSVSTCYEDGWKFGKEQKELCDTLWKAVKKELQ